MLQNNLRVSFTEKQIMSGLDNGPATHRASVLGCCNTHINSNTQPKQQQVYIIQKARYANIYRGWPEELGGQWYPTERGRFSKELLQQLQDDCPDCPMWPDAEDASNAAAADKVPTEKFALMPHWLGISYWRRGRQGYWDAPLTGGVAQQVGMNICLALHASGVFFMALDKAQSSMVLQIPNIRYGCWQKSHLLLCRSSVTPTTIQ